LAAHCKKTRFGGFFVGCGALSSDNYSERCGRALGYSAVLNGRFKGGHIKRQYGNWRKKVLLFGFHHSRSAQPPHCFGLCVSEESLLWNFSTPIWRALTL
jgi:hypothetical protein